MRFSPPVSWARRTILHVPAGMRAHASASRLITERCAAQEEKHMKRILLTIALCASGYAGAQDTLPPVVVYHIDSQRLVENCTPPAAAPECAAFHALLRQNFTEHDL